MEIPVLDFSANWGSILPEAVARWAAALAPRGIMLIYERRLFVPLTSQPGAISVYDSIPQPLGSNYLGQADWNRDALGRWAGGYVDLFMDPNRSPTLALACAVHEIGHALMLSHHDGDSVMTPIPRLSAPTAWDIANAMPGYPRPEPPPPSPPPAPEHRERHKKKRRKHH